MYDVFGPADEVAPGVWLVGVLSGEAPRIAQFAAAPHMARGIGATCFEETYRAEAEIGELRDAVGAVCLDENDLRTLRAFRAHQRVGHHDAIFRPGFEVADFVAAGVVLRSHAELEIGKAL